MAHFALIDCDGLVTSVIVMREDFDGDEESVSRFCNSSCRQTSYNTRGGLHYDPETQLASVTKLPLRKNYAGIGYSYDPTRNAFIPPRPGIHFSLNESTGLWDAKTNSQNENSVK
jgi:hypothetical protein